VRQVPKKLSLLLETQPGALAGHVRNFSRRKTAARSFRLSTGSPRGIRASAYFADYVFGAPKPLKLQVQHRHDLDAALQAQGRDPAGVGILWDILLVVGETEHEAKARRESPCRKLLLSQVPK
jgi:alkanesulfonate monooxygenase SsuD/methylene tetrahydromethanopterin reductase-like flavin-dependent oxidoreductase (luciferase family)